MSKPKDKDWVERANATSKAVRARLAEEEDSRHSAKEQKRMARAIELAEEFIGYLQYRVEQAASVGAKIVLVYPTYDSGRTDTNACSRDDVRDIVEKHCVKLGLKTRRENTSGIGV
ncbi:MAG: hypothetical protein AAB677_02935 [Patescibacteria group bacterium]